jgi:CheY-like chemotaxis protein
MTAIDCGPGTPEEPRARKPDSAAAAAPATPARDAVPATTAPDPIAQPPLRRILLVEDHEDAQKTFAHLLAHMNLDVSTANDGQQACELALEASDRGEPFDWILMDMQMPVVDGYEATRRLRGQGYYRPIIAMTAFATEEDRRECLRFGCNDHISKPIDWTLLAAMLEKWFAAQRTNPLS